MSCGDQSWLSGDTYLIMSDVRPYVTRVPLARVYREEDLELLLILFAFLSCITETETLCLVTIHHQNLAHITAS